MHIKININNINIAMNVDINIHTIWFLYHTRLKCILVILSLHYVISCYLILSRHYIKIMAYCATLCYVVSF